MAAASVTPPGTLDALQFGFAKTVLGTKLEDKYLCSACKNVLRRPFQAQCGHRYCSFCLSSILRYRAVGRLGGRRAPGRRGAWGRGGDLCGRVCAGCSGRGGAGRCRGWFQLGGRAGGAARPAAPASERERLARSGVAARGAGLLAVLRLLSLTLACACR